MKNIKPKDRVIITSDITETNPEALNKTGTVKSIQFSNNIPIYIIQTDENINGFSNKALKIPSGYGVCCLEEELMLI